MARHLLIVEDDPSLRLMLRWEFEDRGYRVTAVSNCRDARAAARRQSPDLALLDYHLPDGSASELLSDLQETLPEILVVITSGVLSSDSAAEFRARGALAFLAKPLNVDRLQGLFDAALGPAGSE